jgi:hypothetical protein
MLRPGGAHAGAWITFITTGPFCRDLFAGVSYFALNTNSRHQTL